MKKILYILIAVMMLQGVVGVSIAHAQGPAVRPATDPNNDPYNQMQLVRKTLEEDKSGLDTRTISLGTNAYFTIYPVTTTDADGKKTMVRYAAIYDRGNGAGGKDTLRSILNSNGTLFPGESALKDGTQDRAVMAKAAGGNDTAYGRYTTVDTAAQAQRNADELAAKGQAKGCSLFPGSFDLGGCIAEIFNKAFLGIAAFFLWMAAWIFNATLSYSLNMGAFLQTVPIVDIGWKIFRDLANICFIFILLYIAINTILQTKAADTKRLLVRVIVVAILLNFSLFFTKVVIDSSNILALQFFEKMGGTALVITGNAPEDSEAGIAQTFLKGLGLSGIYGQGKVGTVSALTTAENVLAVSVGGALLIMVTAFVFLVAAILFIIRTVVLIFVMMLAPLALLCMILPKTETYFQQWFKALLHQSFFAPLYMICLYLVMTIVKGEFVTKHSNQASLGQFLTGNGDAVGTFYVFLVLIALMMSSLLVAKTLGAYGGDFARNLAGKATFGATSWIGRHTAGRAAKYMQESGVVKNLASKSGITGLAGRRLEKNLKNISEKSFDVRSSAMGAAAAKTFGGLGDESGKGGYAKSFEERKKDYEDQKKRVTAKTQDEENKAYSAEMVRDSANALRAEALYRERNEAEDTLEKTTHNIEALRATTEAERLARQSELDKLEKARLDNQKLFNGEKKNILNQMQLEQNIINNPTSTPAAVSAATTRMENLKSQLTIATERHENDQTAHNIDITAKTKEINIVTNNATQKINKMNEVVKEQKASIATKDKILHEINEKYEEDGSNRKDFNAVFTKKANDAQAFADAKGIIRGTTSSKAITDTQIKPALKTIEQINDLGKARSKSYASPDVLDKAWSKIGVTTAKMAMIRGVREEGRKGQDKKLLDQIKKLAKDEGVVPPPPPPTPTP